MAAGAGRRRALGAFGLTEPGGGRTPARPARRPARGRRVGDQRLEGVHHQLGHGHHRWSPSRRSPARTGRPQGDLRDHRARRHARPERVAAVLFQDGLDGLRHPRAPLRRPYACRWAICWAEEGRGHAQFLSTLAEGRIAISAVAVGLAQGCVDECVRFAREREAFGHQIGEYQAIQFKTRRHGRPGRIPRGWPITRLRRRCCAVSGSNREAAIAKLTASNAAMDNARDATQIFGGYGFMNESAVGRFYRDAKILEIGEGTSEVQRMIIARELGL